MSKVGISIVIALLSMGLSSCATMIRGTEQQLSIDSQPLGAKATLSNGQSCITPCSMKLKRDQSVLITYSKPGCKSAQLSVYPTLAGAGVIMGGLIDYGTGAVYNLTPNPATVLLDCNYPTAKAKVKAKAKANKKK